MFHRPIEAATVSDPAGPPPLQQTLALLAAGLHTRFVTAGSTLATGIEAIDRVIAALDSITTALDAGQAAAAVASLETTARQLTSLPDGQGARAARMTTVAQAARAANAHVTDMHEVLRVLRIYGTNIKIAAAGESDFVGFVDGMAERLGLGEQHLDAFLAKLKELATAVGGVQQAERLLAAECGRVVPAVPLRLVADAAALRAHGARQADMARRVADIARDMQQRIGVVLGALQIGDITRQRLEHIVAALEILAARDRAAGADPAVEAIVRDHVHRLLAAQLHACAGDFDREAALLLRALMAMGPDTARLLAIIEAENDGDGRTFLQRLEQGIAEVDSVTAQLHDAGERSQSMAATIVETVEDLTQRLGKLRRMRLDVQHMATNTRLLGRRFGTLGKAVSVIAVEIDVYAGRLGQAMDGLATPVATLSDASRAILGARDDGDHHVGRSLATALATIRLGCHRSEQGVSKSADDARQFVDALHIACDDLSREMAVAIVMGDAAQALSPDPEPVAVADAAIGAVRDADPDRRALYHGQRARGPRRLPDAGHGPGARDHADRQRRRPVRRCVLLTGAVRTGRRRRARPTPSSSGRWRGGCRPSSCPAAGRSPGPAAAGRAASGPATGSGSVRPAMPGDPRFHRRARATQAPREG